MAEPISKLEVKQMIGSLEKKHDDRLYDHEKESRAWIEDRDRELKKFIVEQQKISQELNKLHRDFMESRLAAGAETMAALEHEVYGNGKEGIKMAVDRLKQAKKTDLEVKKEEEKREAINRAWALALTTVALGSAITLIFDHLVQ